MKAKDMRVGVQFRIQDTWYEVTEDPKAMPITDEQPDATVFIAAREVGAQQEDAIVIDSDRAVMTR